MIWFHCGDRKSLGFCVGASIVAWFHSQDKNGLDFSVRVEINFVFVWAVDIDLVSVYGPKITCFSRRHRNWRCFCVRGRNWLDFSLRDRNWLISRAWIEHGFVLVFESNLSWFLCGGIEINTIVLWWKFAWSQYWGKNRLGFCLGDRNLLDFSVRIGMNFVVFWPKMIWF